MKKFLTFVLVLAMVLSVSSVAMAVNGLPDVNSEGKIILTSGDYTLSGDITLDAAYCIEVPADAVVTLDLNGHTISQEKACTASHEMINNKGSLTITGNGKISFKDTGSGDSSFGWGSYTIRNEGTLVVENGTIEHLGEQNGSGSVVHMYCAIFQYSGSTTINGGTISTPTYRSARLWSGEMIINDGNFEGQLWVQRSMGDSAELTIKGGTFAPRGVDGSSVYVTSEDSRTTSLKITDGNFATRIATNDTSKITGDLISGGTFGKEVASALIADNAIVAEISSTDASGNSSTTYAVGKDAIEEAAEKAAKKSGAENVTVTVTQGDAAFDEDDLPVGATVKNDGNGNVTVGGNTPDPSHGLVVPTPAPQVTNKPTSSGSGISVTYNGGNSFSTSNPAVPTAVEIDGVPVAFNGNGKSFTVSCINPGAKWVTVRWNSTTVTTNFTPDAQSYCAKTVIPKTGDVSVVAYALMAVVAAAGAMLKK